jgi:hypothetical protein
MSMEMRSSSRRLRSSLSRYLSKDGEDVIFTEEEVRLSAEVCCGGSLVLTPENLIPY